MDYLNILHLPDKPVVYPPGSLTMTDLDTYFTKYAYFAWNNMHEKYVDIDFFEQGTGVINTLIKMWQDLFLPQNLLDYLGCGCGYQSEWGPAKAVRSFGAIFLMEEKVYIGLYPMSNVPRLLDNGNFQYRFGFTNFAYLKNLDPYGGQDCC